MRKGGAMTRVILAAIVAISLSGCAGLSEREQRAMTGTGIGAAGGAAIGAIAGNAGLGAAIGAGAGLLGGLVVDKVDKDKKAAYRSGYAAGQSSR